MEIKEVIEEMKIALDSFGCDELEKKYEDEEYELEIIIRKK